MNDKKSKQWQTDKEHTQPQIHLGYSKCSKQKQGIWSNNSEEEYERYREKKREVL